MSIVTLSEFLASFLLLCVNCNANNLQFNSTMESSTTESSFIFTTTTQKTENFITNPYQMDVNYGIENQTQRAVLRGRHRRAPQTQKEKFEAKFREYYDCINQKNRDAEDRMILAKVYVEGKDVELPCNYCFRPDIDVKDYKIIWRRYQRWLSTESFIRETTGRFVIDEYMSLIIKKVDLTDSGQYTCFNSLLHVDEARYLIDIILEEPRRRTVSFYGDPLKELSLDSHNLLVYSRFGHWSKCNKCDEDGIKRRIGKCNIRKIHKDLPIKPEDIWTFDHYTYGVPCKSYMLPRWVKDMPQIRDRPDEALVSNCFVKCPRAAAVKTVTDSMGNLVAKIDVKYYGVGSVPKIPKPPRRDAIHKYAGQKIMLKCPTGQDEKKDEDFIRWQNGSHVIDSLTIRKKTKGRVYIDHVGKFFIRRLRVTDTAPFNCWVLNHHIATFKLIVTKKGNKNLKTYISMAGFVITIGSIVAIAFSVCFKKRPRTAR